MADVFTVKRELEREFPERDDNELLKAANIATDEIGEQDPVGVARRILEFGGHGNSGEGDHNEKPSITTRPDRIATATARQRIAPEVEAARQELFGCSDPPFREDEEGARGWLSGAVQSEHQPGEPSEEVRQLLQEAQGAAEDCGWKFSATASVERVWSWFEGEIFGSVWEPGRYAPTTVRAGSPYFTLGRSVRSMVDAVGGYELTTTLHVLTGDDLVVPAAQTRIATGRTVDPGDALMTVLSGDWDVPSHVRVRINRPLTYEEKRDLYADISSAWGEDNANPESIALRDIVEATLGVKAGKVWTQDAWEQVADAWEQAGLKRKDYNVLRVRYGRMVGHYE